MTSWANVAKKAYGTDDSDIQIDLIAQLLKLKAILGEAYQLPETILRKAGSLEALQASSTENHMQIATGDRIQALRDLIGSAQAEKVRMFRS